VQCFQHSTVTPTFNYTSHFQHPTADPTSNCIPYFQHPHNSNSNFERSTATQTFQTFQCSIAINIPTFSRDPTLGYDPTFNWIRVISIQL